MQGSRLAGTSRQSGTTYRCPVLPDRHEGAVDFVGYLFRIEAEAED